MIEEIVAAKTIVETIKGTISLLKELPSANLSSEIQDKLHEMSAQLINAQSEALDLQMQLAEILTRNRELGEEVERLKRWSVQAENYELKNIDNTAFVYALKEDVESSEPQHWLCQPCFENSIKSVLQRYGRLPRDMFWKCSVCGFKIHVGGRINPSSG